MKYLALSILTAIAAGLLGCASIQTAPPSTYTGEAAINDDLHRTLIYEHDLDLSTTPHTVSSKWGEASTITHMANPETGDHHFFLVVEELDLRRQAFARSEDWFAAIEAYRVRRRKALNQASAYIRNTLHDH